MKKYIHPSQRVGITEAGDPAFNTEIFDRLYDANVIITKSLTGRLIDKLVENKAKCILHMTCTGYGGTEIEPFVPDVDKTLTQIDKLISAGFPANQIVLRIDPILPTFKGRKKAYEVAGRFAGKGITRLRFSIMDAYEHVKKRFNEKGIDIPFNGFHASYMARKEVLYGMMTIGKRYSYEIECCGEPGINSIPCISQKDLDILGQTAKINLTDNAGQRKSCSCPANKTELIRRGKPHRCHHQCLYCFWKDENERQND